MTIEEKEMILSKTCLRIEDVMSLTGYSKTYCYQIMRECREKYNGTAGIRSDAILTKSLFQFLGTSLEEELSTIYKAKQLAKN